MVAEEPRTLIPLLSHLAGWGSSTIHRRAWVEFLATEPCLNRIRSSLCSTSGEDRHPGSVWRFSSSMMALFPAPSPEEVAMKAPVQLVADPDHDGRLYGFEGILTFDDGKVYVEPRPNTPIGEETAAFLASLESSPTHRTPCKGSAECGDPSEEANRCIKR